MYPTDAMVNDPIRFVLETDRRDRIICQIKSIVDENPVRF